MKILHIITSLSKAAGTSTFCSEVCNQLVALGHEVTIAVCNPASRNLCSLDDRIRLVSIESILSTSCNSSAGNRLSLVHIHGLWAPVLHEVSGWARHGGIPVVWSTHGMTAPWSMRHKWWKKLPAWLLYQKRDLRHAAAIHCTTDLEVGWNHGLGFRNCFIAPLGTGEMERSGGGGQRKSFTVLFVGRIYPVKGLVNLVRAAALIKQSNNPGNQTILFRIVGPDQAGHQAELMKLAAELGVANVFEWPGPKFDEELSAEYDNCDLLVFPSFTENFGGVVIDALAHGKPVIASKFTPWKVLEDAHCGWWVDNDAETLAKALQDAAVADDLRDRGARGRKLVEDRYSWERVAQAMATEYVGIIRMR